MADPRIVSEELSDRLGPGDSDRHVAAVRLERGATLVSHLVRRRPRSVDLSPVPPRRIFTFHFGSATCAREHHARLIALGYSGSGPAGAAEA